MSWYRFILQKRFFNTGSVDIPKVATRTVNLSSNYFSFTMPEDFSRDMPAEDLVENLDITDLKKFDNPEYGNLIRRWWDIKRPGFFGKMLGTVMMDIFVQRVPDNRQKRIHDNPYDISERLDFLLMLNEVLHQRYDDLIEQTKGLDEAISYSIPGVANLIGKKLESEFRDHLLNNHKWISYSATAPTNQLIVGFVTPLTSKLFVEIVFSYSPNKNVLPREFRRHAYLKMKLIEDSFKIDYTKENSVTSRVLGSEWIKLNNDQVLEHNREKLLIPLFGQNIYEELALQDQQTAQAMKLLAKQDEKSE